MTATEQIRNDYLQDAVYEKQQNSEKTITISTLKKYFEISTSTAYRWLREGKIDKPKNGMCFALMNEKFEKIAKEKGLQKFDAWKNEGKKNIEVLELHTKKNQNDVVKPYNTDPILSKEQAFSLMDALDDKQIVSAIENGVDAKEANKLYYQVETHEGTVIGLSKQGVDECVHHMMKNGKVVREESLDFREDPADKDYVLFFCSASLSVISPEGKEIKLGTAFGTKRQWRKMKSKYGVLEDQFWFEKGSQKALRNAKSKLICMETKNRIIQIAKCKEALEKVNYFVHNRKWLSQKIPFFITIVEDGQEFDRVLEWQQLGSLGENAYIKTRSGQLVKQKQYLHQLSSYDNKKDVNLRYKASATLKIFEDKEAG